MTDYEKSIIRRFAAGDRGLREQAIEIHRKYLGLDCIEQYFMSEIDNPVPDFVLRNHYRLQLLKS